MKKEGLEKYILSKIPSIGAGEITETTYVGIYLKDLVSLIKDYEEIQISEFKAEIETLKSELSKIKNQKIDSALGIDKIKIIRLR